MGSLEAEKLLLIFRSLAKTGSIHRKVHPVWLVYFRRCLIMLFLWICFFGVNDLMAQSGFYSRSHVQEVRITLPQPDWRQVLDSLMKAGDNNTRIPGDVSLDGQLIRGVGVRFKGFSSWNYGAVKNPFNVELDYYIKHKNYQGFKKIKLSNVIHDPSFLREVASYHVARQYLPASQACFAMVYVNDTLQGLYTSVEDVDDLFMYRHYGAVNLPLVKGSPQKLVFPFGQNANLVFLHATDSSAYFPYYALISNYGWNDLTRLIDILNNRPEDLDSVLNVDQTLWMHAFNYAMLNLDSYIGFAQNYYLGMDRFGRFNPIIWDLNMSMGSFRSSDGSLGFQGLSVDQIKRLDPLQHLTFSVSPRPLMTKLFADPTLRRMYLAHIRTIVQEQFESGELSQFLDSLHVFVAPYVMDDTNRLYPLQAFYSNLDTVVGGTGNMALYVGLKEMIAARSNFLMNYSGIKDPPVIQQVSVNPHRPAKGEQVVISATFADASEVLLFFRDQANAPFLKLSMFDDGTKGDSLPDDGIWSLSVQVTGDILQYAIYAQNDSAGVFSPARALTSFHTLYPLIDSGVLVFNEFRGVELPGDHPDGGNLLPWIELHHNGHDTISTEGLVIQLNSSGLQFVFPELLLPPGSFLLLFPDGSNASPFHPGFVLDQTVSSVKLCYPDRHVVDHADYTTPLGNRTWGRYPNGSGAFAVMSPTPFERNARGIPMTHQLRVSPNPASDIIYIDLLEKGSFTLKIMDVTGSTCIEFSEQIQQTSAEVPVSVSFNIGQLAPGVYQIVVLSDQHIKSKKFIKW